MTKTQRDMIIKMRRELKPYSEIAREVGLSANTIKSFCYRHELHTAAIKKESGKCMNCGKQLPAKKTRPRMYCSPACRVMYWRKHRDNKSEKLIESECAICGKKIYDYASAKRKFCSRECFERRGELV